MKYWQNIDSRFCLQEVKENPERIEGINLSSPGWMNGLFIYLWVLTFPLLDCSEVGNFVITLIDWFVLDVNEYLLYDLIILTFRTILFEIRYLVDLC